MSKTECNLNSTPKVDFTPDLSLHRITKLSRFREMINEQKLALVSCGKWDDKNEGHLAQNLRTNEGITRVQRMLEEREIHLFTPAIMTMLRLKTYMQCWTAAAEKPKMWKAYSKDHDGVRFTTRLGKINAIAPLHVFEVEYREALSLEEEIDLVFPDMEGLSVITMTEVFKRKHTDYDFEEEIRLMFNQMVFDLTEDTPGIKKLSFAHVQNFVEGVIVDPRADDDFTKEVEDFCLAEHIQFNGRSTLKVK